MMIGDLPDEVKINELTLQLGSPATEQQINSSTGEVQVVTEGDTLWGGRCTLAPISTIGDGQLRTALARMCLGNNTLNIPFGNFYPARFDDSGNLIEGQTIGQAFDISLPNLPAITAIHQEDSGADIYTFSDLDSTFQAYTNKFIDVNGRLLKVIAVNVSENKMLITPSIDLVDASGNDLVAPESMDDDGNTIAAKTFTPVARNQSRLYIIQRITSPADQTHDHIGLQPVEFEFLESHEGPAVDSSGNNIPVQTRFLEPGDAGFDDPSNALHTQWMTPYIDWSTE